LEVGGLPVRLRQMNLWRAPGARLRAQGAGLRIQDSILDAGYSILDAGYSILDACPPQAGWMLDARCWILYKLKAGRKYEQRVTYREAGLMTSDAACGFDMLTTSRRQMTFATGKPHNRPNRQTGEPTNGPTGQRADWMLDGNSVLGLEVLGWRLEACPSA